MATQAAKAPSLGTIEQRSIDRVFRAILCVSLPLMVIVTVGISFGLAHGHAPARLLGFDLAA
jgi:hypothetical protein